MTRAAVLVLALALLAPAARAQSLPALTDAATVRERELLRLLHDDCGACHGGRLTGGLGPALTPEALADKPGESLAVTILAGRNGTAMPPWRRFVTEAEARWLVQRLREGVANAPR